VTRPIPPTSVGDTTSVSGSGGRDRLWEASRALEGVFVSYLTSALRASVPNGGNPDVPGAEMYGSLLDEHLSAVVANDTNSGIAEALYRQLTAGASAPAPDRRGD